MKKEMISQVHSIYLHIPATCFGCAIPFYSFGVQPDDGYAEVAKHVAVILK
jgi:hypothetical protein